MFLQNVRLMYLRCVSERQGMGIRSFAAQPIFVSMLFLLSLWAKLIIIIYLGLIINLYFSQPHPSLRTFLTENQNLTVGFLLHLGLPLLRSCSLPDGLAQSCKKRNSKFGQALEQNGAWRQRPVYLCSIIYML